MIAINQRVEVPVRDDLGLGIRFPDRADDARLLALQHRRRKLGALEDARKQTERLLHFLGAAQRAQRQTGAVAVEAAAKLRSDVGHAARDLVFRQPAGTEFEQALSERGKPRFLTRVERGASRKIHAYVEHRQIAVRDEIDLRAVPGLPVLDRQQCIRGRGDNAHHEREPQVQPFIAHDSVPERLRPACRGAVADRAPRW